MLTQQHHHESNGVKKPSHRAKPRKAKDRALEDDVRVLKTLIPATVSHKSIAMERAELALYSAVCIITVMSVQDEELLSSLRDGSISFGTYASKDEVRKMIASWARYLMRRWPAPTVDPEDLEQEIAIAIWRILPKWDATRGTPLLKFVRFNVLSEAKRLLHRERGNRIRGSSDKLASRAAFATDPQLLEHLIPSAPEQENGREAQDRADHLRRVAMRSEDPVVRLCLLTLSDVMLDVDLAAEKLAEENGARTRLILGASDPTSIRNLINRAIRTLTPTQTPVRVKCPNDLFEHSFDETQETK